MLDPEYILTAYGYSAMCMHTRFLEIWYPYPVGFLWTNPPSMHTPWIILSQYRYSAKSWTSIDTRWFFWVSKICIHRVSILGNFVIISIYTRCFLYPVSILSGSGKLKFNLSKEYWYRVVISHRINLSIHSTVLMINLWNIPNLNFDPRCSK